mmetsp:Transcript_15787/g.38399  ORF Transcript_15787/g.38399 Transcript_15787/m.38399 type:complete len:278 (-) Transcript_15787:890-1723(-)
MGVHFTGQGDEFAFHICGPGHLEVSIPEREALVDGDVPGGQARHVQRVLKVVRAVPREAAFDPHHVREERRGHPFHLLKVQLAVNNELEPHTGLAGGSDFEEARGAQRQALGFDRDLHRHLRLHWEPILGGELHCGEQRELCLPLHGNGFLHAPGQHHVVVPAVCAVAHGEGQVQRGQVHVLGFEAGEDLGEDAAVLLGEELDVEALGGQSEPRGVVRAEGPARHGHVVGVGVDLHDHEVDGHAAHDVRDVDAAGNFDTGREHHRRHHGTGVAPVPD